MGARVIWGSRCSDSCVTPASMPIGLTFARDPRMGQPRCSAQQAGPSGKRIAPEAIGRWSWSCSAPWTCACWSGASRWRAGI